MTDLNEFRRALQTPDPDLRPLDIALIMQSGARVRRRRRLTVGAASGLAVLVLLIGGGQLARTVRPDATPLAPGAAATTAAPGRATPSGPPSASQSEPAEPAEPPAPPEAPAAPLGDVVHTGIRAGEGEWVISVVAIESAQLPDTTIGLRAARRMPTGEQRGGYLSNETEGSDRTPGFHAGTGAQNIDDVDMPAFGYYVGAAEKITGRVGGRTIEAQTKRWSEDPVVKIFWFDLSDVPVGSDLTSLAAYDADGGRLPTGKGTVAVG